MDLSQQESEVQTRNSVPLNVAYHALSETCDLLTDLFKRCSLLVEVKFTNNWMSFSLECAFCRWCSWIAETSSLNIVDARKLNAVQKTMCKVMTLTGHSQSWGDHKTYILFLSRRKYSLCWVVQSCVYFVVLVLCCWWPKAFRHSRFCMYWACVEHKSS